MSDSPQLIDGTMGSYPLGLARAEPTAPVARARPRTWRKTALVEAEPLTHDAIIRTPEGDMEAKAGDYLGQHEDGHAWPIKRDVFESTYELRTRVAAVPGEGSAVREALKDLATMLIFALFCVAVAVVIGLSLCQFVATDGPCL